MTNVLVTGAGGGVGQSIIKSLQGSPYRVVAADIDLAAMARCTTKKSVHQYPNDKTNPRPIANPNHSIPIGFDDGEPMNFHDSVHAPE